VILEGTVWFQLGTLPAAIEIANQLRQQQPIQETSEVTEDLLRQNPASPTNPMETARQRQRNLIQRGDR